MSLQDLSLDIQYAILSDLTYADIINYCKSYPGFMSICADDIFWQNKLNKTFTIISNQYKISPLKYAMKYRNPNEHWSTIYERWETVINKSRSNGGRGGIEFKFNLDIIMFNLQRQNMGKSFILTAYLMGIKFNKLCVLKKIQPSIESFAQPINDTRINIISAQIRFLSDIGITSTDPTWDNFILRLDNKIYLIFDAILRVTSIYAEMFIVKFLYKYFNSQYSRQLFPYYAAYYGRTDIMEFLLAQVGVPDKYYMITRNDILRDEIFRSAMLGNKISILQWMIDNGYVPDMRRVNLDDYDYCVRQWLIINGLTPYSYDIDQVAYTIESGIRYILGTPLTSSGKPPCEYYMKPRNHK